ncbi:MAG: carbon-nitrogen family hydrolase [Lachnospiraceae bacterium]|nr:carbon-nitrogen family hydrolase [Lachnospiraceae bacterium]
MKIAVCQLEIIYEEKEKNLIQSQKYVQEAAQNHADIIFFPEMSFTGFSMNTKLTGETDENPESLLKVKQYAIENQIGIGFGWVKNKINSENHYTIVDQCGNILCDYIKIHPFSYSGEDRYFLPGNEIKICSFEGMKFGISICYDLRFPELYSKMSEKADMIIVPANWPEKRKVHWQTILRARAIENQVYMVGINCVGIQNGLKYSGNSSVINPNGDILFEINDTHGMRIAEIPNDISGYRDEFPVKKDRRNNLYRDFYLGSQ